MVHALGLAFVPASIEYRSDRLLAGGVVSGDVEQVMGGPREECADDVRVDDIREGVASLGEPADLIPQGLAGLLLATLEVPGVSRADVRPLEISDEDSLEVRPVADAVMWKQFKPCPNMFPHADGDILERS